MYRKVDSTETHALAMSLLKHESGKNHILEVDDELADKLNFEKDKYYCFYTASFLNDSNN